MVGKTREMKIWQKFVVMLTLAFALVIFADAFKIVSRAEAGTTTTTVNMRKTPSKNGDLVKKLEQGTEVELGNLVDGKDGDGKKWYEVTAGGSTGYIRSDLVKKGAAAQTGTQTPATNEIETVTPVGATISGSNTVRVRTSADTNTSNNILSTVNKGTEVTVIGKTVGTDKKTWYQVKLQVNGKDVVGYVRSDYLALSGEIKAWDPESETNEPEDVTPQPVDNDPQPVENTEPKKRYETKLINDQWWILDYEKSEQYGIEDLFNAAEKYKELYEGANKKAKGAKGWIIFLVILVLAACGAVAYLLYRLKEVKEDAFIANIENNTPRRTADRPRQEARGGANGRERPAIKDGLEPRSREEAQRPANGQRSSGQRPAQAGQQRPAGNQERQRMVNPAQAGQQRPAGNQERQRMAQPAQGQQRSAEVQDRQRAATMQQRPAGAQPAQRPAQAGQQRPANPAQAQQRPVQAQPQRMAQPQPQQLTAERPIQQQAPQQAARPKNFVQDSDDMEFEFLNWDSDE